jgi:hypothetical protein
MKTIDSHLICMNYLTKDLAIMFTMSSELKRVSCRLYIYDESFVWADQAK